MKNIPAQVQTDFRALLNKHHVSQNLHGHYFKWLRYFLDFCEKYDFDPYVYRSLPHFIDKLKDKRYSLAQQKQAVEAVHFFGSFMDRTRRH